MVARTPQKQRRVAMVALPPLNSELLKETINKVDKCMERLQELQYTIAGGTKVVSGVNLSPRSTRIYLKTSLRCKQETLRIKNATNKKSPLGKFPASSPGDWRKMSLPAMLLGETVNEILQASQVTRDIVDALAPKKSRKSEEDGCPKTPETQQKSLEPNPKTVSSNIKARRKKEKQKNKRSEPTSPASIHKARSRIVFKIVSPQTKPEKKAQVKGDGENSFRHLANRVSPKHKPWVKKAVLFPNPLFISGSSTQQAKFSRTMSPVIARSNKETPQKFLIRSPTSTSASKSFTPTRNGSNVARKSSVSPKRVTLQAFISPSRNGGNVGKKSPKPSISPTRLGKKTQKLSTAAKLKRSFSPSRLAMRLVSPLKSRKSVGNCDDDGVGMMVSGLKQRPVIVPKRFSMGRI
ncbi:BnaAnng02570D [Brassica napus]|uniref:BnaAnng02570D protein n=1 Tax=Brassica napus TaxID=3708 RepID=A0A078G1C1_BRANA|nr:BnaAnng02570D [Brassica napus]